MNQLKIAFRKAINFIYIGNTWGVVVTPDARTTIPFTCYVLNQLQIQTKYDEFTDMTIFKIKHAVAINDGTTIVDLICQTAKQEWLMNDIVYVDHVMAIAMWEKISCGK